ncbi:hypothetical protein ABZ297_40710 [Nonomuraea sp. NPDC005983]|uniref:hypothetical protein n=1 Tax=Nonomuraea sp. NPDC005983 TaxID=3155595 RepID=UPI0033A2570B
MVIDDIRAPTSGHNPDPSGAMASRMKKPPNPAPAASAASTEAAEPRSAAARSWLTQHHADQRHRLGTVAGRQPEDDRQRGRGHRRRRRDHRHHARGQRPVEEHQPGGAREPRAEPPEQRPLADVARQQRQQGEDQPQPGEL